MKRTGGGVALLVGAAVAQFAQVSARLGISPLVPDLIDAFGVSKVGMGVALSGMWASYALSQYPGGLLSDQFGERRVVLAGLSLLSVSLVAVGGARSFPVFALAVVLLGVGAGLYFTAGASLLTRAFENTGWALGYHTAGGALAGAITPAVVAALAARTGWRVALLPVVGLSVPVVVGFAVLAGRRPPRRPDADVRTVADPGPVLAVLSDSRVAYTVALGAVASFAFQGFASFFPTFLVEYRSFAADVAGMAFAGAFLLGTVALPVLGSASERVGRDAALAVPLSATALALVVLVTVESPLALPAAVGLLGVGLSWGGVVQARAMDVVAADRQGTGFGLVRTAYTLLGASGSVATGALASLGGWPLAFGVTAALLATAVTAIAANRVLGLGL